ncbi:MAG: hydrogenase expression/formation protein HypE [Deltaproteobacteria bacterium]|nr:hydrogenase expression/formation protein HypE [Deltaproteobacteria bacterium]
MSSNEKSSTGGLGACPVPIGSYDRIVLGHGSGGRLTNELISEVFLPAFDNAVLSRLEDQATLDLDGARIAVTTDAFVIKPIFFPGGDIGSLSVHGTINDLAVGGAVPEVITAAFILEEGLEMRVLQRVAESMSAACRAAGVSLVAGDTKVVDRGSCDKMFITTTGIGVVPKGRALSAQAARAGDRVLISGPLGDHGITILASREGIDLAGPLRSDSAPLHDLVRVMLADGPQIRCMRDLTRGGAASALNEIAMASRVSIVVDEARVPVRPEVRGACEILGLDPLYVANEGKLVAIVASADVGRVLAAMRAHPLGTQACDVGEVSAELPGTVSVRSLFGARRVVPLLATDQMPRIC